jgi:protein N-terminal amidase
MDINPYRFEAPWTAYEFFSHAVLKSASVILLTMAWLTTDAEPCPPEQAAVPDIHTLEYWLKRLHPLIAAAKDGRQHDEEVLVALCNRCGSEDGGAHYAGTTTVLGIPGGGDAVTLYGVLGRGEEKLLVVDTADAPHAQRLVLRETDTA